MNMKILGIIKKIWEEILAGNDEIYVACTLNC